MMPTGYLDTTVLPRRLQVQLPGDAQRVYQLAFNSALAEGKAPGGAEHEAFAKVRTQWQPDPANPGGHWIRRNL